MHLSLRKLPVLPVMVVAVFALAGCETMKSAGNSVSNTVSGWFGSSVSLSGSQEVPPNSSQATGKSTISVASDKTVKGDVKVSGMTPAAAHIHIGAAGKNGPVIVPLTKTADDTFSVPAGAKLTDDQFDAYKAGNLYVNVHSAQYKGGEIRAQLKP
jgi:hypothetical protein